jgi:hypothetical protein
MVLDDAIINFKKWCGMIFWIMVDQSGDTHFKKIKKKPTDEASLLEAFNKVWGSHSVICARDRHNVRWCYQSHYTSTSFLW